ncbi:tubulin polyglutamylase TTLL4 [Pelobates cultripes]|uniref:Tubulin polyglutamylase TTLL4 n=1 Tax=Pelobates cultripes TaxID=61616 RepID=A0AAD1WDP9_PELCU|nr:tubulin polyglutamylase TTLL4 [Pelobates cultripes]
MASVEPDLYSRCGGCKNQKLLMPPQPTEVKSRIRVYQSPQIWSLEKKCSDAIHALQKKPVGSNAYHLCFDCHNTAPSTSPSSPLLTAHNTKSSRNLPERTFVFQRPVSGHKPYQKLESLCLRPKSVDQRPYSTSSPIRYPHSTPASYFGTTGAMTTSLMDQFLLPSATGDQLELSPRRPSSVVPKLPCESTRPSLNTNSFLRPSSAKVPLHPHQGNKKTYTCPVGTNSSSWHNGGTGELGQLNGNIQCLSHHCTTTLKFPQPPTSPNIVQGSSRMEPTAWEILEHGSKMDTLPHRIHLTEAVKNLVQSRNVLKSNIAPHVEAASNMAFSKDSVLANCNKVTSPLCSGSQKELIPGTYVSDGAFVNGSLNIASGAIDCAKLAVDANVSNPNIHRQTVSAPALKRESHQPAMLQKSQGVTITVMATQISTIHLNKTHRVPEIPVQSESVLHKLEQPLPNCELEGAEEELPDGLDDRQEEEEEEEEEDMEDEDGEDGDTPDGSLIYSSSDTLLSAVSRQCPENVPVNGGSVVRPALTNSLFPNMPQTVYFGTQDETVQRLPWAQRKLLKWRMSTVTPNVVKIAVTRSHFRVTKKNHDWLGCWGHHMKSTAFKTIQAHQKLNHFPGTFQIGRKDRLWRNLSKMQARFGRKEFNFFPQSFVLPQDIKLLKKAWEEGGTRQKWIVKPPASARGMGIQVIHKWSQLPKRRPLLVQRYLHKPYLISGSKFDLRIYVYVTSYDPLRIYLFSDGLVRFASCKYSSSMKSLSNKFMHLTNYSVNKKNVDYKANSDQTACQGHKWALKALWSYLNQHGFSSDKIWEKIKDMVIKTVIASEPYVNSLVKMYVQKPYSCHELFGFDIMLDENLKPWVLEVNISPR